MDNAGQSQEIVVVQQFRKPGRISGRTLAAMRKRAAKRRQAASEPRLRPIDVAFVTALCVNGGNAKAAAVDVGLDPGTGSRWLRERKVIREAYEQFLRSSQSRMQDWGELIPRAQRRLVDLMDHRNGTVALGAVREIMARGLGPVVQKIDAVVRHDEELTDVQLQAAVSLMASRGLTWTEAATYVRDNREEVAAWALQVARSRQGLILPPAEVVDGSMVVVEPAAHGLGKARG